MTAVGGVRRSRRTLAVGVIVAVALLVAALVAGRRTSSDDTPLSPASTDPDGLRALALLLDSFGADVRGGQRVPDSDTRVALLARDDLDSRRHDELDAWIRDGGTLVVTDATSPFAARRTAPAPFTIERGACDLAGIDGVERLRAGTVDTTADLGAGTLYATDGDPSCFGDGVNAYVVAHRLGAGTVVSVGAPALFTNALVAQADNSVLAVRLLQPGGSQPVSIVAPSTPGTGETTLFELISERVWQTVIQLGIAFVLYALWRARRLGRPVVEPQPVAISGSELVRAVGLLGQRTRAAGQAASAIRDDVGRLARHRYGLAATAPASLLADVVAERTGLDRERVAAALSAAPVEDEAALVAVVHDLDMIRKEVLDGSRP